MLRVTDNIIFTELSRSVMRAKSRQLEAQRQSQNAMDGTADKGKPLAVNRVNIIRSGMKRLDNMGRVAAFAEQNLSASESVIGEVEQVVVRMHELMVQAGSDTLQASNREAIGFEMAELEAQIYTLANTEMNGRYVFSGSKVGTEPFYGAGAYQGNDAVMSLKIAPGLNVDMNIPGVDIFAPTGGKSVFTVMGDLKTALAANDSETIRQRLDDILDIRSQVSAAQAAVGTRLKTVAAATDLREQLALSFAEQRDAVVDTDPAEAFTSFTQTQYSLQAALAQAQKVIQSLDSGLR